MTDPGSHGGTGSHDGAGSYDGTLERTATGGTIRFERHLRFPVAAVWDAITNPERLADWWLPFDADITVDLREGGEMVFTSRSAPSPSRASQIHPPPNWHAAKAATSSPKMPTEPKDASILRFRPAGGSPPPFGLRLFQKKVWFQACDALLKISVS